MEMESKKPLFCLNTSVKEMRGYGREERWSKGGEGRTASGMVVVCWQFVGVLH